MARYDTDLLKHDKVMFEKIYGAKERQDGLTKIGREKYEARYGYGEDAAGNGYNWAAQFKGRKPSVAELKTAILQLVNDATDERILTGYKYDGKQVWLSTENQFNYKAAYDLAVQTEGKSLPFTVKVGTTDEPEYITFETPDDMKAFYVGGLEYVQKCLADGWTEKDSVDWTKYEI
jgi:hypothetical protein